MNFDLIAFGIFILLITVFLIIKRKRVELQKIIFPVLYVIMYRTSVGLKLMDKISSKYREFVKLLGYCFIGFGFIGMIWVSLSILVSMIGFFIAPKTTEVGMVLVLPGTNIPGIGYLSFFYFIISIFILALVHEFAHGVLIRAHNLDLKSSGFAFFSIFLPIIPAAFVEPNEKKMSKKEPFVQYSILSAGPIANVLLSIIFLLILLFVMAPIENKITEPIGFSFDVNADYPVAIAGITTGEIFNHFNGEKVNDSQKFLEQLRYCTVPNKTISLGSQNKSYDIVTTSSTDDANRGFIGISNTKNEVRVKEKYGVFGGIFFWLKDLFKWLYMLNLLIGLVNLLPIYVTDGAKMLYTALESIMKDRKKALNLWSAINLLFVLLIIIGTSATYLKKFGLF